MQVGAQLPVSPSPASRVPAPVAVAGTAARQGDGGGGLAGPTARASRRPGARSGGRGSRAGKPRGARVRRTVRSRWHAAGAAALGGGAATPANAGPCGGAAGWGEQQQGRAAPRCAPTASRAHTAARLHCGGGGAGIRGEKGQGARGEREESHRTLDLGGGLPEKEVRRRGNGAR